MGRTTPSIRVAVRKQIARINRTLNLLPPCEADKAREILEGIEDTLSLYANTAGPVDPVELLLIHLIRKIASGECKV